MSFQLELKECIAPLSARLNGESVTVKGVSIDSRTLKPGELYIAIVGERFDGHDFVQAAQDAGAAAVMIHKELDTELPQLLVENTQAALGQLGKFWASRYAIPTIAVTGSNGKTTVKEIITNILRQLGPVLATKGNLNNELGVPLTLLNMRKEHIYAVVEMGANHAGEIARLVKLVEPDVALVTNIGTAHLEGFGSVEGIANAKSEIYAGLKSDGFGVINADDAYAPSMRECCAHCFTREFGRVDSADVYGLPGQELVISSMGKMISPRFRLAGEHNIMNALAAVAAVQCLDVQIDPIVRGLESVSVVPGRLEKKSGVSDSAIIDDSYNANPDSMCSAIDVLNTYRGKRYLVLGDMAELGPDSTTLHQSIGEYAAAKGINGLWTTGALSATTQTGYNNTCGTSADVVGGHFDNQDALVNDLLEHLGKEVTVLVKGSRSAGMERVVEALTATTKDGSALTAHAGVHP